MKNKLIILVFTLFCMFSFNINIFADEIDSDTTIVTGSYDLNNDQIKKSESDINKEKWVAKPESLKQKLFLYISLSLIVINFLLFVKIIIGIIKDFNISSIVSKKE